MTHPTTPTDRAIARTVVNRIAVARNLPAPWPHDDVTLPGWLECADVTTWGVVELGEMRLRLADPRHRDKHGQVYTPPEIVGFQIRSALGLALDQLAGDPRPLDRLVVHDPFTGCGIYVIHAARYLTDWVLSRTEGTPEAPDWTRCAITAGVMRKCLYANDVDEVAVDLARAVCWLEIGGTLPTSFMDRNISVCDTFNYELPPALAERQAGNELNCEQQQAVAS